MPGMRGPEWEDRDLVIRGIRDGTRVFTGPEHVAIDVTNRCRNRCIACWNRSPLLGEKAPPPSWHQHELPSPLLFRLIDDLGAMGTVNIQFSGGGDPVLNPGLPEAVARVKSHGMYCAVTTGLSGDTAGLIEKLVEAGVDELAVSLWASDGRSYAATHPGRTARDFARIARALRRIGRPGPFRRRLPFRPPPRRRPLLNYLNVICNRNADQVERMYAFALRQGADSVYFTLVDVIAGATDSLLLSPAQRTRVRAACAAIRGRNDRLPPERRLKLDAFDNFERRLGEESAGEGRYDQGAACSIPCYIGWIFCRVLADGSVAPCCRGVRHPIGNLNRDPFPVIWSSPGYDAFRRQAGDLPHQPDLVRRMGCDRQCDNLVHNTDLLRMMEWAETNRPGPFPPT